MPGTLVLELVIDLDVAALIHCDAGVFQTEIVGVRHAAHGEKQMRSDDCLDRRCCNRRLTATLSPCFSKAMHSAFSRILMPSLSRIVLDGFGNVLVFALDQPRPHFDDRDLAAEAAVHLSELQTHIAAADDDQMLRQ